MTATHWLTVTGPSGQQMSELCDCERTTDHDDRDGVLFTMTVSEEGTIRLWCSKAMPETEFGEVLITIGQAYIDGAVTMVAGGES